METIDTVSEKSVHSLAFEVVEDFDHDRVGDVQVCLHEGPGSQDAAVPREAVTTSGV